MPRSWRDGLCTYLSSGVPMEMRVVGSHRGVERNTGMGLRLAFTSNPSPHGSLVSVGPPSQSWMPYILPFISENLLLLPPLIC